MKKILLALTVGVLSTTSVTSISNSFFNHNFLMNKKRILGSIYDVSLKNKWKTTQGVLLNGCMVAAGQEVLDYYGIHLSQNQIATQMDYTSEGVWPNNYMSGINSIFTEYSSIFAPNQVPTFYGTYLRENFGETEQDQLAFQSYMVSAFTQESPITISMNGVVPWIGTESVSHTANIIGMVVVDDNPANTIYTISDNYDAQLHTFNGSQINQLFNSGTGFLFSQASGFDFISPEPNCKVWINAQDFNSDGSCTHEESIKFDLDKTVGILDEMAMHALEGISLPDYQLQLAWGNTFHKQFNEEIYSPSAIYWNTTSSYEDTNHEFSWSSGWATTQLKMRYSFSEWRDQNSLDNFLKFDWWMDTSANGWSSTAMSIKKFNPGHWIYFSY